MKKFYINKAVISNVASRAGYEIDRKKPEIYLALGLVSFAGAIIASSRAALKADEVLKEHEENVKRADMAKQLADENPEEGLEYDDELYAEDIKNEKVKAAVKVVKAYAPVVVLSGVSVAFIVASKNVLSKRYLGAVSAFNSLTEAFSAYRRRVIEEEGENKDRHYRFGTDITEETQVSRDSNGNKVKKTEVTENVEKFDFDKNACCRWFDETNRGYWDPNPDLCMMTLRCKSAEWNMKLQQRGFVFLNEVLEDMGFEKCQEGSRLGWLKDGPVSGGYIDFGLGRNDDTTRRFVNGRANVVLLEFNVDGIIWDKLPKAKDTLGAA